MVKNGCFWQKKLIQTQKRKLAHFIVLFRHRRRRNFFLHKPYHQQNFAPMKHKEGQAPLSISNRFDSQAYHSLFSSTNFKENVVLNMLTWNIYVSNSYRTQTDRYKNIELQKLVMIEIERS